MAVEIKMPQLSDTMSSGKILSWKKKEGEAVARGDILAEVETDKANLEIESFFQGTLLKILIPEQGTATVGELIALIGSPGEHVSSEESKPAKPAQPTEEAGSVSASDSSEPPTRRESTIRVPEQEKGVTSTATGSNGKIESSSNSTGSVAGNFTSAATETGRVKASPLARKLAESAQIDLATVNGSGPQGRIIRKDIEAIAGEGSHNVSGDASVSGDTSSASTSASRPQAQASLASSSGGQLQPLSKMRATIAKRMEESIRETPHFYTTVSINMGEVATLRGLLKDRPEFKGIGYNHFVIKAAAYALSLEPRVNAAYRDGQLYQPAGINIGVITAVEDGLLIPVIRDADRLPISQILAESSAAVLRARSGKPNSTDLSGGTFSISNMGMFDVENFTAIINPGQGAVLAVSAAQDTPVVRAGRVEVGLMMKATLSVDHRIIDGIMAANFLKAFKAGLEHPAVMLMQ